MNVINQEFGQNWALYHGDSAIVTKGIPDNSIGLTIKSPPFPGMYTYTNSPHDMGNVQSIDEMIDQYEFLQREILRATMPGRNNFMHITQGVAQLNRDGYVGMKDFRGKIIDMMTRIGWIYYGEITIDKDPQALRNGSKVLTPSGWQAIEELNVGDRVIGSNGLSQQVQRVFPHQNRQMYKITFTDGAEVECDGNHIWTVRTEGLRYSNGNWIEKTAREIHDEGWVSPTGRLQYEIPMSAPIRYKEHPVLPLDSYFLGVLLGDGALTNRSSLSICVQSEITEKINLPQGCEFRKQAGTECEGDVAVYFINCPDEWHQNHAINALRELGIYGLRGWEKHIPQSYLMAHIEERKNLLRGLLDTDGTIKKNNSILFTTTSPFLARDIIELVRSLGGLGLLRVEDSPKYTYNGEERIGRPRYCVTIQLDREWCPFFLSYKAQRWQQRKRKIRRKIANIELSGYSDCTCIEVENEDGLFITDDFVVTHNCKAMRTKDHGLMFKSLANDAAKMHAAMPDLLLQFRKPGENPEPIQAGISEKYGTDGWVSSNEWINWARPVWWSADYQPGTWRPHDTGEGCPDGIRETDVLNVRQARETNDERHLCPLQLGVIERVIKVWSNPADIIFSPFAGIGSEGYQALKFGRKFIGIELKESYFRSAIQNLKAAETESGTMTLFDLMAEMSAD